jgi:hypothetical protein
MINDQKASVLFRQNYQADAHIVINQGGTSSGKTYAIEQVLFCLACEGEKQVITVVGQDIPNLKAGALRDAQNICSSSVVLQAMIKNFNKTDQIFEFYNGTVIEFKSYDDAQDAKSGKRDYLFVNEANGVDWSVYCELALRTKKKMSTASIVASVMTTYFGLKTDISEIKASQETEAKINNIRIKVLEDQVSLLQKEVDEIKLSGAGNLFTTNGQPIKTMVPALFSSIKKQ